MWANYRLGDNWTRNKKKHDERKQHDLRLLTKSILLDLNQLTKLKKDWSQTVLRSGADKQFPFLSTED